MFQGLFFYYSGVILPVEKLILLRRTLGLNGVHKSFSLLKLMICVSTTAVVSEVKNFYAPKLLKSKESIILILYQNICSVD